MLGSTPSTAHLTISKALLTSSIQSDRMLRVVRLQAHRRLLRQLNPSGELNDVFRAFGSCNLGYGIEGIENRGIGLSRYFSTTRASVGDGRIKDSGRRHVPTPPNYTSRRTVFGDYGSLAPARELGYYSYEQYSDDELGFYDTDVTPQFVDTERWKWRLTQFLRDGKQQEMVSNDKKDRRDYDHIKALVKEMGLHVQLYTKVLVISKVPLPNYRPDLDDRRPQRLVSQSPLLSFESISQGVLLNIESFSPLAG